MNGIELIQYLVTGAGGAGVVFITALALMQKSIRVLSARLAHTENELAEQRKVCNARLEKGEMEFRQILCMLNEIKVKLERTETLALLQGGFDPPHD